jgi:hypothetical protein
MSNQEQNEAADKAKSTKKKRLRGFPGVLWGLLSLLNDSEVFKQNYANDSFDILFVCTDEKYAAYFKVADQKADIDAIENKPEELKKIRSKGKLVCTFDQFMGIASGKIKTKQMLWMIITRKIKIKGMKYFKKFGQLFKIVYKMQKQKLKDMQGDSAQAAKSNAPDAQPKSEN